MEAVKQTRRIGDGTPGPGRPKGSPNKLTKAAREAFELAFERMGGVEKLVEWAARHPGDFYKLYARLIPVEQRISGSEDGVPIQEVVRVIVQGVAPRVPAQRSGVGADPQTVGVP